MLIAVDILLALIAASAVCILLVSYKLASMILYPRIFAYDAVAEEEIKRGHFTREWFDETVHLEEFTLHSDLGYELHCAVWPREKNASFADGRRRVAVLAHGFTYSLLGQIKYASLFHELGFDCVLYDQRNHGLSGKAPTTMGSTEAKDLATVCAWARGRYGEDARLGTLGESMGAATVMLHAKTDPSLAFVVEDCGFSRFSKLLRYIIPTRFHIPAFPFVPLASLFSRLRGGVYFDEIYPAEALKSCAHVPMLFVHGAEDELIPPSMMQECYDAKAGEKEQWLVAGAKHADSFRADPQGYRAHLTAFLKKHRVIE